MSAGKVYTYFVFRLSYLIMAPQPLLSQTLLIFAQKKSLSPSLEG